MRVPRWRLPDLLAASSFVFGILVSPATAQLLGPEFQVNTYTTGYQFGPAVAGGGAAGFAVAWVASGQDGSGLGILGQRFDGAGLPAGGEFVVDSSTAGHQRRPAVAMDGAGDFVVAWDSPDPDGSSYGVFGQRFDATGAPAGSEFRVNSFTTGSQYLPAVASDGAGDFVAAWASVDQDGSGNGVFAQRFDAAGVPAGSEFRVNGFTTGSQNRPAVAADAAGDFVVAWESYGQDGSGFGVFAQRYDPAGLPLGGEFQVNTFTPGHQAEAAVAMAAAGGFVVVWTSAGQDGSADGVFAQRYDAAGAPVAGEFRVNSYTPGAQYWPRVAADAAGGFLVVWRSAGQGGSSLDVFGQRFDPAGEPTGGELRLNSYTTNLQTQPAVAADPSGGFVVTWQSFGQDGSGWGVFGQRLSAAIFTDGFEAGNACAWSAAVGGGCP